MLITLSRRTAICQSVAEVWLIVVVLLGAVSHRFYFFNITTDPPYLKYRDDNEHVIDSEHPLCRELT